MQNPHDIDPTETAEWAEAFINSITANGEERGKHLLDMLIRTAHQQQIGWSPELVTPLVNTITVAKQGVFPGDLAIEEKIASLMRWNALAMVAKANTAYGELGGHIASYASAADLFEVGFNHFYHGRTSEHKGDLVFFQPHSAPGVYARAYLEGRLNEQDLAYYRQEIAAAEIGVQGLSSYPHPWLMPDFWQFPTGSMGIGPISSIYQARFMRYLSHRNLLDCSQRRVWGVFGDGEMDEPESMSALTLAAREKLDNLTWVVNCNLQRLDGPVRSNGRIIDELEKLFRGAGWNVIKLVWGSDWDGLFARDHSGALVRALSNTVDGQMQTFAAKDGRFNRENFFGQSPELAELAQGMTDEQIDRLKRGGHDIVKIYAAYEAAVKHTGQPTVILAHTKKGYGMGHAGQGKMTTHSQKKFDEEALIEFRNRFNLPLSDAQAMNLDFYRPSEDSKEMRYLQQRRAELGGYLPKRVIDCERLAIPPLESYASFAITPDDKSMSTTMVFVRLLGNLLKTPALGARIVPIVADEARTFGMANLFKQVGIYSSVGQCYEPEDIGSVLSYREALNGQILEEGISEAGAIASWTAAATSYANHGFAMLPFYIYYSIFGFQRVGDAIWAAADQRARGFLLGGTSGRTTLGGEGLQHQDGSSHLVAATIPNCKAYDPAFAGELAVIIDAGMREMLTEQQDVFYYITLMNENYAQTNLLSGKEKDILAGAYLYQPAPPTAKKRVTLLGSGAILLEVIKAAEILKRVDIEADIFSITSWSELARNGHQKLQAAFADENKDIGVDGTSEYETAFISSLLSNSAGPIIAATDYVRAVPESIRAYIPSQRNYLTLGTDGFGRSDTRAALRDYFQVDAASIAKAAQFCLHSSTSGKLKAGL
ncbi:pyruvate dehydrogenase (acetyl-transferring), homodimeric type [Polynucleobacter sp. IMCC30063]|uniref:pyruvate dehydrogenase (acetyl-transferring), homodimeric type n=1 Tax=unclassified Polynucleobacter TaxID=2640945 RepID=UPI001F15BD9D|nr:MULTISPECIES: pyruvate dehydrogenase (acetyl-transferring), homodimeric type [unclassified Polynucleobacter]MCE7506697.1 pyruvate dehydrogenase (acetyl-transferring), homodimeric type [Polynucleobacter sp. IMCC30063]MCE7526611.1 pyruvate dehydrogenase (acetyl-transferring), homodimeric type [Polynucleobacter sp. IMCC 30228]